MCPLISCTIIFQLFYSKNCPIPLPQTQRPLVPLKGWLTFKNTSLSTLQNSPCLLSAPRTKSKLLHKAHKG